VPKYILGDSLYPNNTVFEICFRNNWAFIINLIDGWLKTVQTEVAQLIATTGINPYTGQIKTQGQPLFIST